MKSILLLACLFFITCVVSAQTKIWNNSSGNWQDAASWSPTGVPTASDDVLINGNIAVNNPAVAKSVVLGPNISMAISGTLEINGSTGAAITMGNSSGLTILGTLKIGNTTPVGSGGIVASSGASITIGNGGFGSSSLLTIDRVLAGGAINLGTNGTLNSNAGTLSIGQNSTVNGGGIRGTNIYNNVFARINIAGITGGEAIRLSGNTLTNNVSFISISGVSGASAIRADNASVINNDGLQINIENITNTTAPAIQLSGGTQFFNKSNLQIGLQGNSSISGTGVAIDGNAVLTNNGVIAISNAGGGISLANSSLINSSTIDLGQYGTISYGITMGNSILRNNGDAALNLRNVNNDGVFLSNSSAENYGVITTDQVRGLPLYLLNSVVHNYKELDAVSKVSDHTGSIKMFGGSQVVNHYPNGRVLIGHVGNQHAFGLPNLWISGTGTQFLNQGHIVQLNSFEVEDNIVVSDTAIMINDTTGIMSISSTEKKGLTVKTSSEFQNRGSMEIANSLINISVMDSSRLKNSGSIGLTLVGGFVFTQGLIHLEGGSGFDNLDSGKIVLGTAFNHAVFMSGSEFKNNGAITFNDTSGSATSLHIDPGGRFINQTKGSIDLINSTGDGIVFHASASIDTGFVNHGSVKFGKVIGKGFTNLADPAYPISNYGRFDTKTNGTMSLYATVINENGSEVNNVNGATVINNFPFTNKGTINNNGTWHANDTVFNNSMYKGTGLFKNIVFKNKANGIISPGNSTGCTSFQNGLTNQSNSSFSIEVNGKGTACTDFDRVNVTGNLNLAGAALNVTFGAGYTPASNDSITILKSTSLSGVFASNNLPPGWEIRYNTPSTGDVTLKKSTQLKVWNHPSGDWSDGASWSPVGVPIAFDSVMVIGKVDITTQAVAKNVAIQANSFVNMLSGGAKLAINNAEGAALRMDDNAHVSVRGELLIGNTALVDSGIVAGSGARIDIQPSGTLSIDAVQRGAAINLATGGGLANEGSVQIGLKNGSVIHGGILSRTNIDNQGTITIKNINRAEAISLIGDTLTNNGTISIDSVQQNTEIDAALRLSGGAQFFNNDSLRIGSQASIQGTGIMMDSAVLTNSSAGRLSVSKAAAGYGIILNTNSQLINSGAIGLGTDGGNAVGIFALHSIFENKAGARVDITSSTLAGFHLTNNGTMDNHGSVTISDGIIAVQIEPGVQIEPRSLFTNQTDGIVNVIRCRDHAIVFNVSASNPSGGFVNRGLVQFGDIGNLALFNRGDATYKISNYGTLETKANGRMALNASLINEIGGELNNVNGGGNVSVQYLFTNKGKVNNSGNMFLNASMINENGGELNNGNGGIVATTTNPPPVTPPTFTNNGTVSNNGSWNANGPFSNNGLYKGNGIFKNTAFNNNTNGIVSPGNSPGCTSFENGYINQPNSSLSIEVNGKATACVDFDRVNVTGGAALEGGTLNITFGAGYTPATNDMITIFKSTSLSGTFTSNPPAGWTVLYNTPETGDITLKKIDALPLTLLSFDVKADGATAKTTWKTSDEINTSHFELERSKDGISFLKLATIPSMNTGGDHTYSFSDLQPMNGRNYYRLRMVDMDGSYTNSKIVTIDMNKPASSQITAVYPNPVTDVVKIAVATNDRLIVDLVAADGRRILTKSIGSQGVHTINVSGLARGLYFLKVSNGEIYKLMKE